MELSAHEENFTNLIITDNTREADLGRISLFYILATPELYKKIDKIYNFEERAIYIDCFEKLNFSGGFKVMVQLGFNLYNGYECLTPLDIFSHLDNENFDICINAIKIKLKKQF